MNSKMEIKFDKNALKGAIYPSLFAAVAVISLIMFALSLRFLIAAFAKAVFVSGGTAAATYKFQTENLEKIKRYLPPSQ